MLGDRPFRMPDSWYDPPDDPPDLVECPDCGGVGQIPGPPGERPEDDAACPTCDGTGEVEPPDKFEDPDPDRAYEEMRDRRFEED